MITNWDVYSPKFEKHEFDCQHCGDNFMRPEYMDFIYKVRLEFGKPMKVNSGCRCKNHPIEAKKEEVGEHAYGLAGDFKVSGLDALDLIAIARKHGCKRIGLNQKGGVYFVHLGLADMVLPTSRFKPSLWTY